MKLSEAIRLGSMSSPQAFHAFIKGDARCALGAALNAIGSVPVRVSTPSLSSTFLRGNPSQFQMYAYYSIPMSWELLVQQPAVCPHCGKETMILGQIIVHLNDDVCWTRERIADWVETQELQHEVSAPVDTVVPAPIDVDVVYT